MAVKAYALPHNPRWPDEARAIVAMRPGAPQSESLRRLAWTVLCAERAVRNVAKSRPTSPGAAA